MSRAIDWAPSQILRLLRGSSGRVGVTGFSTQYCEIKALFDREQKPEATLAMRQGTEIHLALEEDIMGPTVVFSAEEKEQFTPEDAHGARLGDVVSRWSHLVAHGQTREMPVYGTISGIGLKGIIDEVQTLPSGELLLIDTKTHRSASLAEYKQRLAYHQLLVYCELTRQMLSGETDLQSLVHENAQECDFSRPLHPAIQQAWGLGTLQEMAESWAGSVGALRSHQVAHFVRVDYVDRKTHELQSIDFAHDAETARQLFAFRGELLSGTRPPLPLSRESGSCRYCPYYTQCPARQR